MCQGQTLLTFRRCVGDEEKEDYNVGNRSASTIPSAWDAAPTTTLPAAPRCVGSCSPRKCYPLSGKKWKRASVEARSLEGGRENRCRRPTIRRHVSASSRSRTKRRTARRSRSSKGRAVGRCGNLGGSMVKVGKFWNLNLAPRHSSYWDSAWAFSTMALKIKAICDLQH